MVQSYYSSDVIVVFAYFTVTCCWLGQAVVRCSWTSWASVRGKTNVWRTEKSGDEINTQALTGSFIWWWWLPVICSSFIFSSSWLQLNWKVVINTSSPSLGSRRRRSKAIGTWARATTTLWRTVGRTWKPKAFNDVIATMQCRVYIDQLITPHILLSLNTPSYWWWNRFLAMQWHL